MKKIIFLLVTVLLGSASFAQDKEENESINPEIQTAFRNEFPGAKLVDWTVGNNYYRADFKFTDSWVSAYFNDKAELVATSRYIVSPQLPIYLQASLKKYYAQYWISDLFELTKQNESGYYITLEDAEKKLVLKSSDGSDWSLFQKIRKA